ncbi:hypothetical protein HPB48_015319 [Haemaphysalis longicornis]|uniref:Uncharacterized protein n=1 Tax=Haemaphysalis longicornis TaxID=44386 RepID=A0A9J6FF82_HAELO|nr:hypothetical protein HPB48_015319 [Haemaphysalis longicornis]
MECLRSVLTIAGRAVERDAPQRMATLVGRLRQAFVQPGLSAQARKTLLELIELHASGWQLNLAQQLYYFPYTSLEHRNHARPPTTTTTTNFFRASPRSGCGLP